MKIRPDRHQAINMTNKNARNRTRVLFFIALSSFLYLFASIPDREDLDNLYKMAQFSSLVSLLNRSGFENLSIQDKFTCIECLARSARRSDAEKLLQKTMTDFAPTCQAHATAGIVWTSLGRFAEAESQLELALRMDPESHKARMAMMMLDLYMKKYRKAQQTFEESVEGSPGWAESYVSHLLGMEVYGASGNTNKIADLYGNLAGKYRKLDDRLYQNFRKNSRLFRTRAGHAAFRTQTTSERIALPFVEPAGSLNCPAVSMKIDGKPYNVLLDTGNRAGWTIHSRELEKKLKNRSGGTVLTQIGAEEEMVHGHYLLTKQIYFRNFTLLHMPGIYVPKPFPGYPEANLNPLAIKDRVVTLDFIHNELVLRTKDRFHDDLGRASSHAEKLVSLPWYGYEQAFIPVMVNNEQRALAMIETGAEDITINLDFARRSGLTLEPATKYLQTGKEFSYHTTLIRMDIGHLEIRREETPVWFLEKMADPLSGLMPDVLLGPDFFKERFVLTFDPFQKIIIISEMSF